MKKVTVLIALVLASLALVACGGDDSDSNGTTNTGGGESTNGAATEGNAEAGANAGGGGASSTLKFEADPGGELAYTTTSASTQAGEVTIEFDNPQSLTHDVAIESSGGEEIGKTELIANGSDSTVVNLKPGFYTFYCSVPGHREAGMEGALSVK